MFQIRRRKEPRIFKFSLIMAADALAGCDGADGGQASQQGGVRRAIWFVSLRPGRLVAILDGLPRVEAGADPRGRFGSKWDRGQSHIAFGLLSR